VETLKVRFSYPYREAGERCMREALSRPDYDPVSLFRWGNMMAMSVLAMLEAAERELGRSGQSAMVSALERVGRDIGRQILEGITIPADALPIEFISAYASWINREIYASPEAPRIEGKDHCSFDILWCPHQDSYRAFDCRVQRYLVQGMLCALREKFPELDYQVKVRTTIPAGSPVCTFDIRQKRRGEVDDWEAYSSSLADKALERSKKE
jgi:hypothetical protein